MNNPFPELIETAILKFRTWNHRRVSRKFFRMILPRVVALTVPTRNAVPAEYYYDVAEHVSSIAFRAATEYLGYFADGVLSSEY